MEKYYFTFGGNHWHRDGIPMKNFWVTVTAESYLKARLIFMEQFSGIYMQTPQTWSFQYEEKDFKPEYFPAGEFMNITQSN